MKKYLSIFSYISQYGNDEVVEDDDDEEDIQNGFDGPSSNMKAPPPLFVQRRNSYDRQATTEFTGVHPSIAGFPSHNRKVC